MHFEVGRIDKRKSPIPPLVSVVLFLLFFYIGTFNSIVFYEKLPKEPPQSGFLVFYQPSCPHCIAEIPTIKKLLSLGYNVSAVNVYEAPELASRYNVQATPTIVILPQETVIIGEASLEELLDAYHGNLDQKNLFGKDTESSCKVGDNSCS